MASRTAHDFLQRICYDSLDGLAKMRSNMLAKFTQRTSMMTVTLDCDALLFASSGRNARMSYKGVRGYMPMLAFWEDLGMWCMRSFATASPDSDALVFLEATHSQLPAEANTINVRSHSVWYQASAMDYCEEHGHGFYVGADQDEAIKQEEMSCGGAQWKRINVPKDSHDD